MTGVQTCALPICLDHLQPGDDRPGGEHLDLELAAGQGIKMDEVEDVLLDRDSQTAVSKSSGEPITFGYTASGRYLAVVWEHVLDEALAMRPITAYEVPEPGRRTPQRTKR